MCLRGGGRAAVRSLWLLKWALELLITNEDSPNYGHAFYKNYILLQSITYNPWPGGWRATIRCILEQYDVCIWERGGGIAVLQSLWILKRALELNITNEPPPNFIWPRFLQKAYILLRHSLQPLPRGMGEFVMLKYIVSGTFNCIEQNGYLKILIRSVLGNDRHGGGGGIFPPNTFDW